ncbi:hypothetical protein ACSBR1_009343 [Camellia fascicularis]
MYMRFRPPYKASKYISYEQRNMSFKLCTLDLLSNLKITSFQSMRKEELSLLVKFIEQAAQNRVLVDLSAKKYEDEEFDERGFKGVIQEGIQLAAKPNIGDYFPYVGALDLQGLSRKMKALSKVFDEFFEKIIDEHALKKQSSSKDRGQQTKDFVDIMLAYMDSQQSKFQIDRNHVKALILDMLAASMDTHQQQLSGYYLNSQSIPRRPSGSTRWRRYSSPRIHRGLHRQRLPHTPKGTCHHQCVGNSERPECVDRTQEISTGEV